MRSDRITGEVSPGQKSPLTSEEDSPGTRGGSTRLPRKLAAAYSTIAVHWLNSTILLVLVLVLLTTVFRWWEQEQPIVEFNPSALKWMPADEAEEMFGNFQNLKGKDDSFWAYTPWVGFAEGPVELPHLNIDPAEPVPIRRTPRSTADRNSLEKKVVWLFGGSTAFGWAIADEWTLAAQLERQLQVRFPSHDIQVVNHAHAGYYSSQEAVLFQWLLREGKRAHLAVFLDGLNESWQRGDTPSNSAQIRQNEEAAHRFISVSDRLALGRMIAAIQKRLNRSIDAPTPAFSPEDRVRVYLSNVRISRATAASFDMSTLFVWQPTPFDYMHPSPTDGIEWRVRKAWPENIVMQSLNQHIMQQAPDHEILFLAPLFEKRRFLDTYVDSCHYGDEATAVLAAAIVEEIASRSLL
jgi:hypothetical protein